MEQIWQFNYNHRGNSFDLIVFRDFSGYIMKIFMNGAVIHNYSLSMSNEVMQDWKSFQTSNIFQEFVDSGIDWVKDNF